MEGIKFLGLLCAIWLFVEGADAVQFIKKLIKLHPDSKPKNIYWIVVMKLVNCSMCTGFWAGLIYYQSFTLACLTSVVAELFARTINLIFSRLLNQL